VILATLVAMALAAQSRLVKQWNDADLRLEAARVADDLISSWWELGITVPHKQSGQSATHPDWRWQTTPLEDQQLLNDHLEIVRVSIFAPPGSRYGNMPLCEIDLLTSLDVGGRK
jgi:hypothetical protein